MATLVPELDNPIYHQRLRLRGYAGKVNVFLAVTDVDRSRLLRRLKPDWSSADHRRLARDHAYAAANLSRLWNQLIDEAARAAFGRPFEVTDYRVSGIGSDDFADEHKRGLRFAAHAGTSHRQLARAHEHAARHCR